MKQVIVTGVERLPEPHLLQIRVVVKSKGWWQRKPRYRSNTYVGDPRDGWQLLGDTVVMAPPFVAAELTRAYNAAINHLEAERARGATDDPRFAEPVMVSVRSVSRPTGLDDHIKAARMTSFYGE